MEKHFEIIAPAGNIQSLAAAVKAKADAVYFGFKGQNARGRAENFDEKTILKAIAYLKEKGIKSYITLNTVLTDNELSLLEKRLKILSAYPPDAIIIQDFAVLELGKKILPDTVEFHASTQMGICNLDGLRFTEKIGLNQVVLARELSFKELKYLSENTKLKLEVFVFGAMCYSASGFCYASLKEQRRSGNRGICAQICRHRFNNNYPFSMKELDLIEEIPEFLNIGIKHFKIEGRMKGADYVYTIVSALNELKKDLSNKGIERAREILKEYLFLRDRGKGYFYFPENKKIFTEKKHSIQIEAGKVKYAKGKTITFERENPLLKQGIRIKIGEKASTIIKVNKNIVTLSSFIPAKKGDKAYIFPNKESIKGIKGIVNEIEKREVKLKINLKAEITKNKLNIKVFTNKKVLKEFSFDIETEQAKARPLNSETLLVKLKSPYFEIESAEINKNNFVIKHSVFKEIKSKIKEIIKEELNKIFNYSPDIYKEYPPFNYLNLKENCQILPPVYYEKIKTNDKCIIVNNVGQLIFPNEKYTGKFLPVCNKVAAYFLKKNFKVKGFLKPYELEPTKDTPHFVVRVKPEKLPKNFKIEKQGEIYLIYKIN
ncbi:peptidase U32 [Thermotomaculum hydrothermale]|uniref:Peptidase U32 n=1 Tax=Thermotomaculum hydrothermale TaxID=981385 RepID=A0A7R6PTL8_9BACT|nr:U32 family peptidase [Thermotomaculum hydrothermale]BBB32427.1 peptidase U32 [Thermotomaculum hydrothermale]